ncbi:Neuropeptide-Like Protein [Caenorhabditis elegans]|uniref:Neuropeptide-Like Protein n=1 Tax=Caenorhabditis elegans TaxID=6239 RepID=Q8MQ06_CAEEL|nr:Neuropeptide-Like Protein [Caenorhabditis elegans]CAD36495.1 Neuropeptide-Like Protein [Caenorhabditis elegans]|eukprot:NP_741898.1 Neuropeptide-Like Protein [Caenorhabditis elegans]
MLLRGVCLALLILVTIVQCQNDNDLKEEKRRIGLRLPNFLRFKDPDALMIHKRRIGLRLPNMLKFKDSSNMYHLEKRRMGMRLPNIIFLRNEKKNVLEY